MEFYEEIREEGGIYVKGNSLNHIYPAHFHINPEILVVNKGGYELTVAGRKCSVGEGDIAVIDSYETHSYDRRYPASSYDDMIFIFPYSLVGKLMMDPEGRRISEPVIHSPELCAEICALAKEYLLPQLSETTRRAAATLIISRIFEHAVLGEKKKNGEVDV